MRINLIFVREHKSKEDTSMQARGPLMVEHRLIERMISVIKDALVQIESTHRVDPVFVDTAVDFIRIYADRTHHGKEENILFRDLDKRPLSADIDFGITTKNSSQIRLLYEKPNA
jgi:hemerythrin-like domain-containing protein